MCVMTLVRRGGRGGPGERSKVRINCTLASPTTTALLPSSVPSPSSCWVQQRWRAYKRGSALYSRCIDADASLLFSLYAEAAGKPLFPLSVPPWGFSSHWGGSYSHAVSTIHHHDLCTYARTTKISNQSTPQRRHFQRRTMVLVSHLLVYKTT